jgi:hypothetical protein
MMLLIQTSLFKASRPPVIALDHDEFPFWITVVASYKSTYDHNMENI